MMSKTIHYLSKKDKKVNVKSTDSIAEKLYYLINIGKTKEKKHMELITVRDCGRKKQLIYAGITFIAGIGLGLIELNLFEAHLAPLGIAVTLSLLLIGSESIYAFFGCIIASLCILSTSTIGFCCFIAPLILIKPFRENTMMFKFGSAIVLLFAASIVLGLGSFIKVASHVMGECIVLILSLTSTLFFPEKSFNPRRNKITDKHEILADDLRLRQTEIKAHLLADVIKELSKAGGDAILSRHLSYVADKVDKLTLNGIRKVKKYEVQIGSALLPKGRNSITGDSCEIFSTGTDIFVALSDGMGSGINAEKESGKTLELIKKLIKVGFSLIEAADCVNVMMLNSGKGEMYATLDAALIDLSSGRVQLLKSGAAPSWLMHNGEVRTLYSEALPIGIIRNITPAVLKIDVAAGDTVIMMTDGVADALGMELVASIHESVMCYETPEQIAEALLNTAKRKSFTDDMSVVIINIENS